ncbi:MAG: acyl-CoA dehydrogenase family protein, partial [Actinomycetes bacterium]
DGPVVTSHDGRATTERVEAASQAGCFLLATASGDEPQIHLINSSDAVIEQTKSLDPARDLGRVTWEPRPDTVVAAGGDAAILIDAIATRSALAAAAQLCGLSEAMLSMTAAYAVDRQQFGKPIGSFQAIKHLLADVRVALEFARPAVYRAAWALDVDDESQHHDAALAKALASDLGTLAATTCLQVHGGIGYTWEHDLQLFMKRAWGLAAAHGDAATQRARALGLGLGL